MAAEHMFVGALSDEEIYPHFGNNLGYWGVRYPTKSFNSNQSQFCFIQSPEQGIYVAHHDPTIRYLLQFTFEQHPGVIDWNGNAVPRTDEISGLPVHLRLPHLPLHLCASPLFGESLARRDAPLRGRLARGPGHL